jgi:hypothetical protein
MANPEPQPPKQAAHVAHGGPPSWTLTAFERVSIHHLKVTLSNSAYVSLGRLTLHHVPIWIGFSSIGLSAGLPIFLNNRAVHIHTRSEAPKAVLLGLSKQRDMTNILRRCGVAPTLPFARGEGHSCHCPERLGCKPCPPDSCNPAGRQQ